jgi:hypothetical protein
MTSNPENIEGHVDAAVDFCDLDEETSCSTFDMAADPARNKSGMDAAVMAFHSDSVVDKAANHAWTSLEA